MKAKTRERIFGTVCALGFFLLLGSVGGMEHDTISLKQGIVQSLIGLAMFAGGGYWGGLMQ